MFRKPTVFVLGAGASWHYGYPTGEQLVGEVIEMAKRVREHSSNRQKSRTHFLGGVPVYVQERSPPESGMTERRRIERGWQFLHDDCSALIQRLRAVRPLVIDYFLFQNPDLRSIGTFMIAAVIIEREARWTKRGGNDNRSSRKPPFVDVTAFDDDWYRFVVHRLLSGCSSSTDFEANNVNFITFNYDASLEYHVAGALKETQMLDGVDVAEFVRDRTVHVYGCVHTTAPHGRLTDDDVHTVAMLPQSEEDAIKLQKQVEFLNRCWVAASSIRTIGQHNKDQNEISLHHAKRWIEDANVIYILGYGFDRQNNKRIGLEKLSVTAGLNKRVYFTNFEDPNTVNKSVSHLLFGEPSKFIDQGMHSGGRARSYHFEKSKRDVYQALAKDFDAVEDCE